ncbi:MAG: Hpt domain-containing protein, partial [Gammaproteobacteria bacterium]|nr:Hpt domain-containing protein [Gammaproteobacteria bacterium]
ENIINHNNDFLTQNKQKEQVQTKNSKKTTNISSEKSKNWDTKAALTRVGGQAERLLPLIELFLNDIPIRLDELQEAVNKDNDDDEIRRAAHTIKGVAANLGALKLQHLAAQIESDVKLHKLELIPHNMSKLVSICEQLKVAMMQYMNEHSSSTTLTDKPIELNNKQLLDLLQPLAEKIQTGDYIETKEVTFLKSGTSNKKISVQLRELYDQISQFDFNTALETLNDIIVQLDEV